MVNIGGDDPLTRWKGNLMGCILTIQTINMTNGLNKNRRRNEPTKREGPRVQGIFKK